MLPPFNLPTPSKSRIKIFFFRNPPKFMPIAPSGSEKSSRQTRTCHQLRWFHIALVQAEPSCAAPMVLRFTGKPPYFL
jgi:hypothetical protein